MRDIEGKAVRPDFRVGGMSGRTKAASEWSRGEASDIDGQTDRSKWAGAHESMWATSEFRAPSALSAIFRASHRKSFAGIGTVRRVQRQS
jgi:hypothetical protein